MKIFTILFFCLVIFELSEGASIVSENTVDPSQEDDVMSIFGCFQKDELTNCLQKRAFRALENWLPDLDSTDEGKTNEMEETDVKLKEMPPMVRSLIDRLGDIIASGIVQFYPEESGSISAEENPSDSLQSARGHKKKVKKAIKKIIIKFLVFLYVLQQASKLFLQSAQTFIFFKFMVIAGIYVLTNAVKVFHLIKYYEHKDHSPVVYVDKHHVDDHHFPGDIEYDHPGHHDPIWGRSTVAKSTSSENKPTAQHLAYFKQIPQFLH